MDKRIYKVEVKSGSTSDVLLVKAKSKTAALKAVAKNRIVIDVASQFELIELVGAGKEVIDAEGSDDSE